MARGPCEFYRGTLRPRTATNSFAHEDIMSFLLAVAWVASGRSSGRTRKMFTCAAVILTVNRTTSNEKEDAPGCFNY